MTTDERRTVLLTVDGRGRIAKREAIDTLITDTILSTVSTYLPAMLPCTYDEAWTCLVGDVLKDPLYFSPPVSPSGTVVTEVTTFHRDYPAGRVFRRAAAVGAPWIRVS